MGNYKMDCRYNTEVLINKIELIAKNKSRINLYNIDAIEFIKNNINRTKTLLWLFFDPPYYVKGKQLYTNFYESQQNMVWNCTQLNAYKHRFYLGL